MQAQAAYLVSPLEACRLGPRDAEVEEYCSCKTREGVGEERRRFMTYGVY